MTRLGPTVGGYLSPPPLSTPIDVESKLVKTDKQTAAGNKSQDGNVDPGFSEAEEKKLVTKLDKRIVPLAMLLYTFSFLDRVNIGNARLYKLEADLGLRGEQYQIAVSIFFVTYLLFEIPSNLLLKPIRPSRWLAFIATSWGLLATLTGLASSYGSLLALRLLLGVVEAGLFPGLNVYLTFWYTKRELALRVGYLFVSAAIAGSLGGLLAYGVGHLDGRRGMSGWRWIFIIEGLPSIVLGLVTWIWLPDEPETGVFLSEKEREIMRLRRNQIYGETGSALKFSKRDMWAAFKDWKVWAFCIAQFGVDTMLYGYSTFLPTIIEGLAHWTTAEIQLLTIPCYFLGAVVYMVMAWLSDRLQQRGIFVVIFGSISVIGYGVLLSNSSAGIHYFGCFLVAMGLYVAVGLPLAWLPNNTPRYGKRTTANGMQLTMGNMSGIMTPFIYLTAEGPRFVKGNAVSLSMVGTATCIYGFMCFWFARENRLREAGLAKVSKKHEGQSAKEMAELGDDSPKFRYTC